MPERRKPPTTADRLGRMLVIVPYLIQHPGTTLDEASTLFDVPVAQLRQDLDLVFLAGLPPYGPGDLIDVLVEDDGSVWISMADHFARPVRLTRQEALAVNLRATELLATPGVPEAPALGAALRKLRAALGEGGAIVTGEVREAPEHLQAIHAAAAERSRVRIGYVAASTGVAGNRAIDPESVFASAGNWYVVAWDLDADEERLFRVDRITAVEDTGERFEPRGLEGAGRPLYTPSQHDIPVRLRLAPAARWVGEYYACTQVHELEDGGLAVTLPTRQVGWIARLLLRLGHDAEVLGPPEVAEELRAVARATLARYGA
jgi:proteasome accessory factor C